MIIPFAFQKIYGCKYGGIGYYETRKVKKVKGDGKSDFLPASQSFVTSLAKKHE
jgi:hypothetical protein